MATATNYKVDYDDKRFQQVEADKQTAINEMNNTYNQMVGQSDQFYQDQINASKDYAQQQQDIQNQNTQFTIDTINQQKEQAEKDYTKEQSGAYVDWQKQSNQYGANAETMAAQGLQNTGYSESSQVSMYNQYQSRVATARESFSKAVLNYDNSIKEAQLANNSKLAEIAYNALQTQLELSLQGFQYKNSLLLEQLNAKQELENTYHSRYQDVLNQINTENSMAEQVRQYNESLAEEKRQFAQNYALQKEQFTEQKRQYEQEYKLQVQKYNEDIRQFNTQIAYYKEKDAKEYALKIKQLEEEKRQREIAQKQWEKEYSLKEKQMAQEQSRWEKEYALAKKKASTSGSTGGNVGIDKPKQSTTEISSTGQQLVKLIDVQLKTINYNKTKLGTAKVNELKNQIPNMVNDAYKSGKISKSDVSLILSKYGFN
jgi:hypothetical protein